MKYNTQIFIEKANIKHNNQYDYSKVNYTDSVTPVEIICPIHGSFFQSPVNHLRGRGCPQCAKKKQGKHIKADVMMGRIKNALGDGYDLSKAVYVNASTPMTIICPKHGEFKKFPFAILSGQKCPMCNNRHLTTKDIIEKFHAVHGDKYDYSKVEYHKMHDKVCIICPEHGEFWQTPNKHLKGQGCPKCGKENASKKLLKNNSFFIQKAKEVHGNKYDYSKVNYVNSCTPVTIICPQHGEFQQLPHDHLNGHGCPKCAIDNSKLGTDNFIKIATAIHKGRYDYSKVNYINSYTPVEIICPVHGSFWQKPGNHLKGCGCSVCGHEISKAENEIYEYVISLLGRENVENRNRTALDGKEIDIFIPSKAIGIEYNGLKWHSSEFHKESDYHLTKLNLCNQHGIKLITIFEDEYINHKNIVLNKIRHLIGKDENLNKIYARKCSVKLIDNKTAKEFLDKNHIQGFGKSTIYIGSFYGDKLIGVMSFLRNQDNKWELTRFATDNDYLCVGIGGKLFKYFTKNYNPLEVKSFADRRWTVDIYNNLYIKLGFQIDKIEQPDYKYFCPQIDGMKRIHKFNFRKQILHKKFNLPLELTESEMADKLDAWKIYDCGLVKYVWKRKEKVTKRNK